MKKILIVISNMGIGGAEKSLLSFLKSLTASAHNAQYRIHLMVVAPGGALHTQVPEAVVSAEPSKALRWLGMGFGKQLLTEYFSVDCAVGQLKWFAKKAFRQFPKEWNVQQQLWENWKDRIPAVTEEYDVAISYNDGYTGYFVMEKVTAKKKVLWVHSEYQKLKYDPEYDRPYYEKADAVVTISEKCRECILQEFPQCNVSVLENITIAQDVLDQSVAGTADVYGSQFNLLTVARLNPMKGVDIAVDAAKLLKASGVEFCWLVIGDGPEREHLQEQIQNAGVEDCFRLLGSRDNPYPYIKNCDILVQSSRVEGRSIVLDEAKILEKPIVATNYTTVSDSLTHGVTGWIVDMTPEAVAQGIMHLWENTPLRNRLQENLRQLSKTNEPLLQRYMDVML